MYGALRDERLEQRVDFLGDGFLHSLSLFGLAVALGGEVGALSWPLVPDCPSVAESGNRGGHNALLLAKCVLHLLQGFAGITKVNDDTLVIRALVEAAEDDAEVLAFVDLAPRKPVVVLHFGLHSVEEIVDRLVLATKRSHEIVALLLITVLVGVVQCVPEQVPQSLDILVGDLLEEFVLAGEPILEHLPDESTRFDLCQ